MKITNYFKRKTINDICSAAGQIVHNCEDILTNDKNSNFEANITKLRQIENEGCESKKIKIETTSEINDDLLQSQIEENKLKAEILLQSKKLEALSNNIGSSWYKALKEEFKREYFLKLSEFLKLERKQYKILPPVNLVYSWTHFCTINEVKVVILGQDPYHNIGQAHGLCFSVAKNISIPPSLINIYEELSKDIPGFIPPNHGNLQGWASQGVLLLNACLTVRAHNANSHKDQGWENLTDATIKWISNHLKHVVFLFWGSYAQKKEAIVNKKLHCVLKAPHPSPLSAHKGFFGCKHFSQTNDYLIKHGKKHIDWCYLP